MSELNRRDFLKIIGLAGTTAAAGCSSESGRTLIPYIIPPEEIIPGEATWYASTCRECPAGCGLLAKNRDGRVIKVEGNPLHPINQGRLCARGQASVQGFYNPDRIRGPLKRTARGRLDPITWKEAENLLGQKVREIADKGKGERIAFITQLTRGTLTDLISLWLSETGARGPLLPRFPNLHEYEPLSYEPLRAANETVFGMDGIPTYHIDQADLLISFGADFLETWLSPVEYTRKFTAFREPKNGRKNPFVYVGPRLSLTGANADRWISVPPGTEYLIAMGLMLLLLDEAPFPANQKAALRQITEGFSLEAIINKTGVKLQTLRAFADDFAKARRPLALAGGLSLSGPHSTEAAISANLLSSIFPGNQETIDFNGLSSLSALPRAREMKGVVERMTRGEVDLLLLHNANPVFSLPASWSALKAIKSVPFIVSFSPVLDETSEHAHLCLPTHSSLESWGDYSPKNGVWGFMQPVMGPLFDTRHLGDILLSSGKNFGDPKMYPWQDFFHLLQTVWRQKARRIDPQSSFEDFWVEALKKGGVWKSPEKNPVKTPLHSIHFRFPKPVPSEGTDKELQLIAYPTLQFFDGREANRPWLQELPDPLTQITWGNWLEIHPETAKRLKVKKGDLILLESPSGSFEIPAYPYSGIHPGTVAIPIGQGHTSYGRFADNKTPNPLQLLGLHPDMFSGAMAGSAIPVTIKKTGKSSPLANTDGSLSQHGREIARTILHDQYQKATSRGERPKLRLPLPEGYSPEDDLYSSHAHPEYRWAMAIDLDRCTGCGACVIACHAENNVASVGKEQVLKGREMAWLRIERFWEAEEPLIRFIPMLCQHCDNAPCEAVCPMFAPHHGIDGLNNQVYNRCIGTFFCSQNCPYKVRRFNWFTFTRPKPLNWQLNPDVTVRQKGVMEKCSFCIQRIVAGKNKARTEGRKVRDNEITPACSQTCPAGAMVFGNLVDPNSRISKLIQDPRAYQVFENLNTKPAVIYLKKIVRKWDV
jgi:anaerobic selenocysteine-containing dehydrogenase/Fe-S-cluster-containing dehydrogenase component